MADSELFIRIEKDYTLYGDECKFGGGKSIRDGMGQCQYPLAIRADGALDVVITNAVRCHHYENVLACESVRSIMEVQVTG
ncbi:hypothetical protein UB51_06455 [Paenibacillus sp. IHBB 10380]|nr:hypothetical protein UB51_06455 [Paenibacillus sp. IHBB 10380]